MAIRIKFDTSGTPQSPTFVLANQIGNKYGLIDNTSEIVVNGNLTDTDTITFTVHKQDNGVENPYWDLIKDFKLVWCREWDQWFVAHVTYTDERNIFKNVELKGLGESETAQLNLIDYEINTEADIDREDYAPTVFYNPEDPAHSLLNRLLKVAPHYSIGHVDDSLRNIQRTFTFNGTDLYSAFQQVQTELDCLIKFNNGSDPITGLPLRQISAYDLEDYCLNCHKRFDPAISNGTCPECGSHNIVSGYGEDTTIFFSTEDLANSITIDGDEDSMKNCFRFSGGDDFFTATVRNCLPDGSGYYWYITDEQKEDMPLELSSAITSYQSLYQYYNYENLTSLPDELLEDFVELMDKYADKFEFSQDFGAIKGFQQLNKAIYEVLDFSGFLENSMLPTPSSIGTTAAQEAAKLTVANLNPVAVPDATYISGATADNAVLGIAKAVVNPNFKVKINSGSLAGSTWTGNFLVTNYYDPEDTATSQTVSLLINDDFDTYLSQRMNKVLAANPVEDHSITELFKKTDAEFRDGLKDYNLVSLQYLLDACQSCMDILIENGVSNPDLWISTVDNLYERLYVPYLNKYSIISEEISTRQDEVAIVSEVLDSLQKSRKDIQDALNLQNYLGNLWPLMYVYRREGDYQNSNYISEGLSTAELFKQAMDFLDVAIFEVHRAAIIQQSLSADLNNLLVIDRFKPLVDHFEVGNFIRGKVDGKVFKMRLLSYQINYDDISGISVEFSNVVQKYDSSREIRQKLDAAASMSSTYSATVRQANSGATGNNIINSWFEDGLAMTQLKLINDADSQNMVYDEHGMLMRRKDELLEVYDPVQMRWINSTLAITDDAWETTKAVFGKFYYRDPVSGEYKEAFGVNGEVIVGKLLLGEQLGLYNSAGTMTFDENGLTIQNDVNIFRVDPNSDHLLEVVQIAQDGTETVPMYLGADGSLHITALSVVSQRADQALEEAQRARTLTVSLSHESQAIPTDENGMYDTFPTCETTISCNYGDSDVTGSCTFTYTAGANITASLSGNILSVTALNDDESYVDINVSYVRGTRTYTATKRFTVYKAKQGAQGEMPLTVTIESSAGNIFKNRGINTILTCTVMRGTEDLTSQVSSFTWKKKNENGQIDDSWTRVSGSSIVISPADVNSKAVFLCEVSL